ncbi:MAG: outer membrane beta-barrel protein [Pseudomonadota bacterium]
MIALCIIPSFFRRRTGQQVAASAFMMSVSALSFANPYVEVGAAHVMADNGIDDSVTPSLKLGYELTQFDGAVELELQRNHFERKETGFNLDAEKITILVNYKHHVLSRDTLNVSIVAGAGISATEYNVSADESDEDGLFTFKLAAVADRALNNNWYANASIAMQSFDEFDEENGDAPDSLGTQVSIGAGIGYRIR